ncbi:MAG: Asp-tRNA(Asn)/Glu-tRNA(Gln) amidotransferase subunit GatC [Verrucomicrobiae bacterium]|nr:Asp-tRNA(Asn)/Glu-tRNA(Gln) amidotransferase subunit GatC [Verrucomicrobiae bacterium]
MEDSSVMALSSDKFDINYVAGLARIALTLEESEKFQSQLDTILENVKQLQNLALDQIEPTAHSFPVYNIWRADEEKKSLPVEVALKNAPNHTNDLILMPKIVDA